MNTLYNVIQIYKIGNLKMHMCKIDKYIGQVRLSTEANFWYCNKLYIGISTHMIIYWGICCQIGTKYVIHHLITPFVDCENQRNWNENCCTYSKIRCETCHTSSDMALPCSYSRDCYQYSHMVSWLVLVIRYENSHYKVWSPYQF